MLLIGNITKAFIPLCLFVWALLMPTAGSYTFIALYTAFWAYLSFADLFGKPKPDPSKWSANEIAVLQRYHLALKYRFGARTMSCQLNGFRMVGLLFAPWLLWNHMWVAAAIVVAAFFVTGSMSVRLDPFYFLGDAVKRGQMEFADELAVLQQVSQRLWGP
jgi:hypothetical protein